MLYKALFLKLFNQSTSGLHLNSHHFCLPSLPFPGHPKLSVGSFGSLQKAREVLFYPFDRYSTDI